MSKVFISYRQLNDALRQRVREFGERIRLCGVEVVLDQFYLDDHPGASDEGWTLWSENQAEATEKVLIIATEDWFHCYLKTAPPGKGLGAAAEAHVIHQRITAAGTRAAGIRIVVLDEEGKLSIPPRLQDFHHFDLRRSEVFDQMIRWLGGTPPLVATGTAAMTGAPASSWVWHATLESKAAGQVSVLACVETLLAVVLYWGIAIHWHTHWHLISSVFIAPLLLLRSPESMKLGVTWFLGDWFGFNDYKNWPKPKRWLLLGLMVLVSGIVTYGFARWMSGWVLAGQSGWGLFGWSVLVDLVSVLVAVGFAFAFVALLACGFSSAFLNAFSNGFLGAVVGAGVFAVAFTGWFSGAFAILVVVTIAITSPVATPRWYAAALLVECVGIGFAIRGLVCRICATLVHLRRGFLRLPENWKENNFLVDSFIPAELLPGIRQGNNSFCFDGLFAKVKAHSDWWAKWLFGPCLIVTFFLPAFLYRFNIKATCWFWWPLAYLLKPLPQADEAGEQKQALCWPWDNPWQKLLILGPALLVTGILIYDYYEPTAWLKLKNAAAVPIPLKLILGMEWAHLPPWHWALLIVEACGLGMLMVAGKARSHKANDNWAGYARQELKRDLVLMHGLARLRSLATWIFLLLGLGMCLISFPPWQKYVPAPVVQGLEEFYHSQDLREQERQQERADAKKEAREDKAKVRKTPG